METNAPLLFKDLPQADEVLSRDHHALRRLYARARHDAQARARYLKFYQRSHQYYERNLQSFPKITLNADLPIIDRREEIARCIAEHQVTIICGETGSGKTTQLPQICLSLGLGARGMIAHTQPRRIAARSVAARIAEELQVEMGGFVGYQVRFDERLSAHTRIKLMTDGMLLSETLRDRFLKEYEVIIIDEAHERSLNIDFLIGYLHRLLPKRPDLKVIITSATIDAEKFAQHFHNAPVVQVSGRSYPIELRYRPIQGDNENEAILAAIQELEDEERGDILLFLPTERDIRNQAEFLSAQKLPHTEIIPLFGRLSLRDQQKVFHPQAQRRIVLATNVAETSITVPRIRYVIDTGTARISRYSLRSKTQRLPIEPISRAAANQRSGRCGRLGPGVCIRLYSEEDFLSRAEFTEAEILRTNLAAVILQMLALHLGQVEDFPFVDQPDERQINDGYRLLFELGAVDEARQLTTIGASMARLPLDPRYGRILLEAEKQRVVLPVLIILCALSIQDPRERPYGQESKASQAQNLFKDPHSDFLSLLKLFYADDCFRQKNSRNQSDRWRKRHFLNPLRMHEWRALVEQMLQLLEEQKYSTEALSCLKQHFENDHEAQEHIHDNNNVSTQNTDAPEALGNVKSSAALAIHRALLVGFLDQLGLWDEVKGDYLGSRQRHFNIFPGSVLAKKKPKSIMAAEITELSRVFALTCAPIDLADAEQLAAHLIRSSYGEPYWSSKQGNVLVKETVYLYGLPIVSERSMPYARINPKGAHEIFVMQALVEGDLDTYLDFVHQNEALIEEIQKLEDKTRSRDWLIGAPDIAAFYFARLPQEVFSVATLEQWHHKISEAERRALYMQREDLIQRADRPQQSDYPDRLHVKNHSLSLSYHFSPGDDADGVTALLPLSALNAFETRDFERLVPAMLPAKIEALLRSLPKMYRRQLMPLKDNAERISAAVCQQSDRPLLEALCVEIKRLTGMNLEPSAFDLARLEAHHRMNFRILDSQGRSIASGRDLHVLQEQFGQRARQNFQQRLGAQETRLIEDWPAEGIPTSQNIRRADGALVVYPALNVRGQDIILQAFDQKKCADLAHRQGVLALLRKHLQKEIKYIKRNSKDHQQAALAYRKLGKDAQLDEELIDAALMHFMDEAPELRSLPAWQAVLTRAQHELIAQCQQLSESLQRLLQSYSRVETALRSLHNAELRANIQQQLHGYFYQGFIRQTPRKALPLLEKILQGVEVRLHKQALDPSRDRKRQNDIAPYDSALREWMRAHDIQEIYAPNAPAALHTASSYIEALRINLFAQEIGSPLRSSEKKVQESLEDLRKSTD